MARPWQGSGHPRCCIRYNACSSAQPSAIPRGISSVAPFLSATITPPATRPFRPSLCRPFIRARIDPLAAHLPEPARPRRERSPGRVGRPLACTAPCMISAGRRGDRNTIDLALTPITKGASRGLVLVPVASRYQSAAFLRLPPGPCSHPTRRKKAALLYAFRVDCAA